MSGRAPAPTRLTSFRVAVSKSATVPRSVLSVACSATAMVRPWTATELAPGVASVPTFSGELGSEMSSTSTVPAWAFTEKARWRLASYATISEPPSSKAPVL